MVIGQNGIGQNGTDKMVGLRSNCYGKMVAIYIDLNSI